MSKLKKDEQIQDHIDSRTHRKGAKALNKTGWAAAFLRQRLLEELFTLREHRQKYSHAKAQAEAFARSLLLFDRAFKDSSNFSAIVAMSSKSFREQRANQVVYNRMLAENAGDIERTKTQFIDWLRGEERSAA